MGKNNRRNILRIRFLFAALFAVLAIPSAFAVANFAISTFSCTPSEVAINDVFSCTAQITNTGGDPGSVSIATLYPDSNNWLESSTYSQASGTSLDPGVSTEVTFSGLRAIKSGNNGFSKIMLDDVTDQWVADNNVKENVVDVIVTVSNTASSAAMGGSFDSTAQVTAGGNIDVTLTFTVNSGGCSIGNQDSSKSISGMQNGNKQSRSWTVTQGTSGNCRYTISAAAEGEGGIASKIDSSSSTVTCTDCPEDSSSSSSSGGGGGGIGTTIYDLGDIDTAEAVDLGVNENARFNFSGVEHRLILRNITETGATIEIRSEKQTFTLFIGDEKLVDLDNDTLSDISIKLKSVNIATKKARLILKSLSAGAGASSEGENAGINGNNILSNPGTNKAGGSFVWIIIAVIAVAGFIGIVLYRAYRKRRYYIHGR